MSLPALHVLTGPTAVGKTELALQWAEANNAEIVSCDSLLFYRGMNIGTAKPTRDELERVPHHLVDIRDVTEPMTIADYVVRAQQVVADIQRRGRAVLVTGGSGFYLKAFFGPVVDQVTVPAEVRDEVERRLEQEGLASSVAELRALNPTGLDGLDLANPRRVLRALERCRVSGKTLQVLKAEFAAQPGPFAEHQIKGVCLTREGPDLNERIELRVEQMLQAGLVTEVEGMLARGLERNPSAARSIGYRETIAMLAGERSESELAATIAKNTRALAKKQRTWFRTQLSQLNLLPAPVATAAGLFD
ncbi:tRNA (adenosine(37)-N6)-dimethylallyltransferase MiaA [Opitutaceae bacterium]|nr:tRNA (adenosine(37)-N6)-dimethylallyltransferase MiaA [Opitutaceae bacterium]